MIRRKLMIALFALGTVGGFASGIHSMRRHCRRGWERDRQMNVDCRDGKSSKSNDGPRHHGPRNWGEEE
ncbi:MAG: hypothetical protein ABI175_18365 [Polyangiales bacterium]